MVVYEMVDLAVEFYQRWLLFELIVDVLVPIYVEV